MLKSELQEHTFVLKDSPERNHNLMRFWTRTNGLQTLHFSELYAVQSGSFSVSEGNTVYTVPSNKIKSILKTKAVCSS